MMEDAKERMIAETIRLIEQNADCPERLTVRRICGASGVAVGLINYYFGNKEALIEVCVERIVRGIVDKFGEISVGCVGLEPYVKLEKLSVLTLNYLFEHSAFSKISMLSDLKRFRDKDNTSGTYRAFVPLVAAARPDLGAREARFLAFRLVGEMQNAFLRADMLKAEFGIDLYNRAAREAFHAKLLGSIIINAKESV